MSKNIKSVLVLCLAFIMAIAALSLNSIAATDFIPSHIKSVVFDAKYYSSNYADLSAAFGNNTTALYNHFLGYGVKEGRQASPIFDATYYLKNNGDLKAAFGTNREEGVKHFGNFGYKERDRKVAPTENLGTSFEASIISVSGSTVGVSGTNVVASTNSKVWTFNLNSDGTYTITNKDTGMNLEVANADASSGANIQTTSNSGDYAQKWYIFKYSHGKYIIRSKCAPLCVMTVSGNNIVSSTYNGSNTQILTISSPTADDGNSDSGSDSGNNSGSDNDTTITPDSNGLIADFYSTITGVGSGKCLDISSDNVVIKSANGSSTQQWHFVRNSDGTYTITNKATGKALDVSEGKSTPGTNVLTYTSNGTNAQQWYVKLTNGKYVFEPKCAIGSALDVAENKVADGTNVQIYTYNATTAQWFDISIPHNVEKSTQLSADTIKQVVSEMTLKEKLSLVKLSTASNSMAGSIPAIERFGIPTVQFADGPAGLRLTTTTLAYPSGTTLASTWNNNIVQNITSYMGDDCRDFGVEMLLAPGLNIQKNIFNGRNFEYFSEDPLLTGLMAANYTKGLQSTGVSVALKHYAANNQETNRYDVSVELTERALREIYLRAFDYAVDLSDPASVMTAYNRIQGTHAGQHKGIVDILRNEFGFQGFVMTDWGTQIDRNAMILSGHDMYCGGFSIADQIDIELTNGLNSGRITMADLDACCERILNYIVNSNAMKNIPVTNAISDRAEKLKAIRQAGAEGTVLLKNDNNTLPLPISTVSLFGNASYRTLHSGFGAGYVNASDVVDISEGLQNSGIVLNSVVTAMYANCGRNASSDADPNPENDPYEIEVSATTARNAARISDCAIFTVSRITAETYDHANKAGDYYLNAKERQAIENLSSAFRAQGKKLIVIINTGNPIEVASWAHLADAIIYAGLSGEQIGNSVADVIRGKVTPSGKLSSTWPIKFSDTPYAEYYPGDYTTAVYNDDIYVGYRYYETFGVDVMYEFGYGLSYTTFDYSNFRIQKIGNNYRLSVDVTNTGKVAGSEVVQFYVTKPDGKNEHPAKELVGYGKTSVLAPNRKQTISITVTSDELRTYSEEDSCWFIEKGEYKFYAAASVKDVRHTGSVTITNERTVFDTENMLTDTSAVAVITKDRPKFDFTSSKNIALGATVTAPFSESGCPASNVTDGNLGTRWSAAGSPNSTYSVVIDLKSVKNLKEMLILWEANVGGIFEVSVSSDNRNWTSLGSFDHAQVNLVTLNKSARYVRVQAPKNGYFSIYEIGIYQ